MNTYKNLTKDERETAKTLLEEGFSLMEIALKLKRYPSTLNCEFRRKAYKNSNYSTHNVQDLFIKKMCNSGRTPMLKNQQFHKYVRERRIFGWSAKQISEKANNEKLWFPTSTKTSYGDIDSDITTKQRKNLIYFKRECEKYN